MQKAPDIYALWPSTAELARDIGAPFTTVASWKQRGSIPAMYWRAIVRAASRRGHPELTIDLLASLHARGSSQIRGFDDEGTPALPETPSEETVAMQGRGQFSRWKHLRRSNFTSSEEIAAHVRALREEWDRR